MKKYLRFLTLGCVVMFLTFALCACGSDDVSDESITVETTSVSDMDSYVNDVISVLAEMESTVMTAYDAVTGDNYSSDLLLYNTLVDVVIPASEELLAVAESYEFADSSTSAVHAIYVQYAEANLAAFELILAGLEEGDIDLITEANDLLTEAGEYSSEWITELLAAL